MTQKTATPRPAPKGAETQSAPGYAQERLFPRVLTAFREERLDREIMTEMGAGPIILSVAWAVAWVKDNESGS
jgi:hypothetical protein